MSAFFYSLAKIYCRIVFLCKKYRYIVGILLGLGLYAVGAFLFIPAAEWQDFSFFCISLYILPLLCFFIVTVYGYRTLKQAWNRVVISVLTVFCLIPPLN